MDTWGSPTWDWHVISARRSHMPQLAPMDIWHLRCSPRELLTTHPPTGSPSDACFTNCWKGILHSASTRNVFTGLIKTFGYLNCWSIFLFEGHCSSLTHQCRRPDFIEKQGATISQKTVTRTDFELTPRISCEQLGCLQSYMYWEVTLISVKHMVVHSELLTVCFTEIWEVNLRLQWHRWWCHTQLDMMFFREGFLCLPMKSCPCILLQNLSWLFFLACVYSYYLGKRRIAHVEYFSFRPRTSTKSIGWLSRWT